MASEPRRRPGARPRAPSRDFPLPPVILAAAFLAIGAVGQLHRRRIVLFVALIVLGCIVALSEVHRPEVAGAAGLGFWLRC